MTTKRKKASHQALNQARDRTRLAQAVATADLLGPGVAAKRFRIAYRTLRRWCERVRTGKDPELANLVAQEAERAKEASRDLVTEALNAHLRRAIELAPKTTASENQGYIEKLGELTMVRDVLMDGQVNGTGASPKQNRESSSAEEAAGGATGGEEKPKSNLVLFRKPSESAPSDA